MHSSLAVPPRTSFRIRQTYHARPQRLDFLFDLIGSLLLPLTMIDHHDFCQRLHFVVGQPGASYMLEFLGCHTGPHHNFRQRLGFVVHSNGLDLVIHNGCSLYFPSLT